MTKPTVAATETEAEFDERREADRERFKEFLGSCQEGEEYTSANPGYALAREYFQYYLARRPSKNAAQALAFAFRTWRHLTGVSDDVRQAVSQISEEPSASKEIEQVWTEVWESLEGGIIGPFQRDGKLGEGFSLIESLAATLTSPTAEANLLQCAMVERLKHDENMQIARRSAERIRELDTSGCDEWIVRSAKGCLYECDNLNIGQAAPTFRVPDMEGILIDLADFQGSVVLLNFWSTTCPFCPTEFPYLRECEQRYPDRVRVIGVSLDEDISALRCRLDDGDIAWPQICEGNEGRGTIPVLYNVYGIPHTYVISSTGMIAAKRVWREEITELVGSLLM